MTWLTRRWRLVTSGAALAGGLAVGILSDRWFVRPHIEDPPGAADAVVMFGGAGPRFERAVSLVESDHIAPALALSDPNSDNGPSAFGWYCAGRQTPTAADMATRYGDTLCFDPDPDTTFGEAKAVQRLAAAHGWQRVDLRTARASPLRRTR